MSAAPDLLRTIVAATERTTALRREREPLAVLEARAAAAAPDGARFERELGHAGRVNVIAECKRRSPSRGVLIASYDPAALARAYQRGGAAAISVLTEPTFFDGALDHLEAVRRAEAAVEKLAGCPVWLVSVGADREQTVMLHNPFN